ncbi:MAG: AAA family ATPase [Fimbriimonadales bacterium]
MRTNMSEKDQLAGLEQIPNKYGALLVEVHKVIVGQDDIVRDLVCAMLAKGHCLLIGVPGLAKTLLVKTLAQSLSWDFKRIQFTPDLMPSDIIGTEILDTDPQSGGRSLRFVKGPVFANVILADEINRTPPKTQSALLEAMQEYAVTVAGHTMPIELPFFVVATQNPIEQEGTYPLPEAQLDRFMYCLHVGYPSPAEEEQIAITTTTNELPEVKPVLAKEDLMEMQRLVREIPISPHVVKYAVSLARASRPESAEATPLIKKYAQWGAGPRAAQYLLLGAKALAVTQGKPTPTANDVRALAPLVLRHRIIPNYAAVADDIGAAQLVEDLVRNVREPAYAHGT